MLFTYLDEFGDGFSTPLWRGLCQDLSWNQHSKTVEMVDHGCDIWRYFLLHVHGMKARAYDELYMIFCIGVCAEGGASALFSPLGIRYIYMRTGFKMHGYAILHVRQPRAGERVQKIKIVYSLLTLPCVCRSRLHQQVLLEVSSVTKRSQ